MWRLAARIVLLALLASCTEAADETGSATASTADTSLLAKLARQDGAAAVHRVRITVDDGRYVFEPAQVRASRGDIVRFVQASDRPGSVALDPDRTPEGGAEFVRSHGLDTGPLLVRPGQVYDVSLTDAPEGRYIFHSVPRGVVGAEGVLVVGG